MFRVLRMRFWSVEEEEEEEDRLTGDFYLIS